MLDDIIFLRVVFSYEKCKNSFWNLSDLCYCKILLTSVTVKNLQIISISLGKLYYFDYFEASESKKYDSF